MATGVPTSLASRALDESSRRQGGENAGPAVLLSETLKDGLALL